MDYVLEIEKWLFNRWSIQVSVYLLHILMSTHTHTIPQSLILHLSRYYHANKNTLQGLFQFYY